MSARPDIWNSDLYQSSHSFVWQYGRDLLVLLNAQPGERILDVGCGTGQLTSEITQFGAEVVGIDSSPDMISTARKNFPQLRFEVADVTALNFEHEFDVVVSNAALHWVRDQQSAIASIARALKARGRLVLEMGGRGNLHNLLDAVYQALHALGVANPEQLLPWSFPSIGEYAPLLEGQGLEVDFAVLFDRATILEGGDRGLNSGWRCLDDSRSTPSLPSSAKRSSAWPRNSPARRCFIMGCGLSITGGCGWSR